MSTVLVDSPSADSASSACISHPCDTTTCLVWDRRGIRMYPDPVLSERAFAVAGVHEEMPRFADALIGEMLRSGGRALAAPQIGVSFRVIAARLEGDEPVCLVNPGLRPLGRRVAVTETCLNRPGVCAEARRYRRVGVTAWDHLGQRRCFEAAGALAFGIQHAVDHLDGVVISAGLPVVRGGEAGCGAD